MVKTAEQFIESLRAIDCSFKHAELPGGRTSVTFFYDLRSVIFVFDADAQHVGLITTYDRCPKERIPDLLLACNTLNKEHRWLKFYVDDNDCLTVSDDAIIDTDTAAHECFELLSNFFVILRQVDPVIKAAIVG